MKFGIILLLLLLGNAAASVLYVNITGKDGPNCGLSPKTPCQSIRHALVTMPNQTKETTVLVDGSGGEFKSESAKEYINIRNSVTLISVGKARAVIACAQSTYKLFSVVGHWHAENRSAHESSGMRAKRTTETSLKLDGFEIQGCVISDDPTSGSILLLNSTLRLFNSVIRGNGVLVYHPQIDVNNSCATIHLIIQNVTFVQNFIASPFVAAISLFGCASMSVQINNASFTASPISMKSEGSLNAAFNDVDFRGQHSIGPLVDITLAPDVNYVSFTRCNMSNMKSASHSALSLRVERIPKGAISVSLSEVNFIQNNESSISGPALSIISRFSNEPANINLSAKHCQFINNSALDDGGAIYLRKVSNVKFIHCSFVGNSGTNGGAIWSSESSDILLTNCQFIRNFAHHASTKSLVASGGAILASHGVFRIVECKFTQNSATFSGSAGHFTDLEKISIQDSSFFEYDDFNRSGCVSPRNSLLFISAAETPSLKPTVTLIRNRFLSYAVNSTDHSLIMLEGQISNTESNFICPMGRSVKQVIETPENPMSPFKYLKQQIWCRSCPTDTYMMRPPNKYSDEYQNDNVGNSSECLSCPERATCNSGLLNPYTNYWASYDEYRAILTLCPEPHCNRKASLRLYEDGSDICINGRTAPMCAGCANGFSYKTHLTSYACVEKSECWSSAATYLYLIGFCFILVTLLVLIYPLVSSFDYVLCLKKSRGQSVWGGISSGHDEDSPRGQSTARGNSADDEITAVDFRDHMNTDHLQTAAPRAGLLESGDSEMDESTQEAEFQYFGWFLSLIHFYQLLPIVYPRLLTLPGFFNQMITVFVELFRLTPPLAAVAVCPVWASISAGRYFSYIMIYWIEVAILLMYFVVIRLCTGYQRRHVQCCVRFNLNHIMICCYIALLFLQLFTFVPLTQITFESLNCIVFDGKRSVYDDIGTQCLQPWQIFAIFYCIIFILPQALTFDITSRKFLTEYLTLPEFLGLVFIPLAVFVWLPLKFVLQKFRTVTSSHDGNALLPQQSITSARFQSIVQYVNLAEIKPNQFTTKPMGSLTEILCGYLAIVISGSLLKFYPTLRASILIMFLLCILVRHATTLPFNNKAVNRFHSVILISLTLLCGFNLCISVLYEYSPGGEAEASDMVKTMDILYDFVTVLPLLISVATVLIRILGQLLRRCRSA